ncbi:TPA: hypothetical protein N0F65_007775 [Lagenidium giganteum]|uniref:Uncharacterized protein n=1 Tax=Lagenidium giganteum TaxID=4803 RepID=A0AAV2YJU7_9STRA|nr:TPA: hypothetical protein N0F65_007775 [Lagenidium giganteum]
MVVNFKWLSFLSFSWFRRCKSCHQRGKKCVCKRPSLTLEHIFYLEARKNKYGARNFSHVSDTAVTSSTVCSTSTTMISSCRCSLGDEPSTSSHVNWQSSLSTRAKQRALVRNNSGQIVMRTHSRKTSCPEDVHVRSYSNASNKSSRQWHRSHRTSSHSHSRCRQPSFRHIDEGCSYQFYGRSGAPATQLSNTMVSSRVSNNDSMIVRTSTNSYRVSMASDRMSLDNNFGSVNHRGGLLLENGSMCSSVQEDDEALRRLKGWFQSSTPTNSSAASRYHYY